MTFQFNQGLYSHIFSSIYKVKRLRETDSILKKDYNCIDKLFILSDSSRSLYALFWVPMFKKTRWVSDMWHTIKLVQQNTKKGYGLTLHSRWPISNRQHNTLVKQCAYFIDWKKNRSCWGHFLHKENPYFWCII